MTENFCPESIFIPPPIPCLICFFCYEDMTEQDDWNDYANHLGGHSKTVSGQYKDPFSEFWTNQLNFYLSHPTQQDIKTKRLEYLESYAKKRRCQWRNSTKKSRERDVNSAPEILHPRKARNKRRVEEYDSDDDFQPKGKMKVVNKIRVKPQ